MGCVYSKWKGIRLREGRIFMAYARTGYDLDLKLRQHSFLVLI